MKWQKMFVRRNGSAASRRLGSTGVSAGSEHSEEIGPDGRSCRRPQGGMFGVGAQVIVHLNRSDGAWPPQDDPIGIVVAPGEELGTMYWAPPATQEQSWWVQFEQPFYGLDGSGPHTSARVAEKFLELAPLER